MFNNNIIKILFLLVTLSVFSLLSACEADEKKVEGNSETVEINGITINYSFLDKKSSNKKSEISTLVSQAFTVYTELFGGLPRDLAGKEYTEFSLQVKHGRYLSGETDPQIIMFTWSDDDMFGFHSWETALLHELLHFWIGESFKYKDGREHWFNEGFSEYYAFKAAIELGVISPEEALSIAVYPVGYYSASKGLGNIAMRDAGIDDKTKFDNYFLIYHGGWVVAMILDHDIRTKTNDSKNLDGLMSWMYTNFHRNEKLYALEDIIIGLKETTDIDYTEFLNNYVVGVETIPVSKYLHLSDALFSYMSGKRDNPEYKNLYRTIGIEDNEE